MTVTVHHLDHSRSHRILWLLEELGVPYELRMHERHPRTMRAPEGLRALHPLGKAPVVQVDDVVLAESGAIIEELLDRYDPDRALRPAAGTDAHRAFRYWLHYVEGSLMTPLLLALITGQLRTGVPLLARPFTAPVAMGIDAAFTTGELKKHAAFLEASLTDQRYLVGDVFTAADIHLGYPIAAALDRQPGFVGPNVRRWFDEVSARPAYERAIERGGPTGSPA